MRFLSQADEDPSEGRHRSKKARGMASASPARPMTQDEFEETIGKPPPIFVDPTQVVDPETNRPPPPQALWASQRWSRSKKARDVAGAYSARPVFQDEFEETIGRSPPVPVDSPRVLDPEVHCPPLPRAFWPSQRFGKPARVIAEITLDDEENNLVAEEKHLLDAPDS